MARRPDLMDHSDTHSPERRSPTVKRRKLGRIIRDERGAATMEWEPYGDEETAERVVLQVLETPSDGDYSVVPPEEVGSGDLRGARLPYGRSPPRTKREQELQAQTSKASDLRKLSEWIKASRKPAGTTKRGR